MVIKTLSWVSQGEMNLFIYFLPPNYFSISWWRMVLQALQVHNKELDQPKQIFRLMKGKPSFWSFFGEYHLFCGVFFFVNFFFQIYTIVRWKFQSISMIWYFFVTVICILLKIFTYFQLLFILFNQFPIQRWTCLQPVSFCG